MERSPATAGYLQRTDQQFHWENRGYDSFDGFLAALSSSKRKNLRKERAAVRDAGITFDWLTGTDLTEGALGPVLRILHGHGRPQMGHALSHPRILQPRRRRAWASRSCWSWPGAAAAPLPARSTSSATACCTAATGAASSTCRSCISRPATIRPSTSRSRSSFHKVEAGAQGEHKLLRGYLPTPTYSAHYIAHPGLRRAVADYLDREREAVAEHIEELTELARSGNPSPDTGLAASPQARPKAAKSDHFRRETKPKPPPGIIGPEGSAVRA